MLDARVVEYLKKGLGLGYSREALAEQLRKSGFDSVSISEAFDSLAAGSSGAGTLPVQAVVPVKPVSKRNIALLALAVLLLFVIFRFASSSSSSSSGGGSGQDSDNAGVEQVAACAAELGVLDVNGTSHFCYGGEGSQGYVEFMLENRGSADVWGLKVVIGGSEGTYTLLEAEDSFIAAGGVLLKTVPYDYSRYGSVNSVQFIPKVSVKQEVVECAGRSLTFSAVVSCEQMRSAFR